ncbi:InlB B-repeat-containing protein [Collinsella sp. SGI.033]|uniref:InlB B-repeat-containing protein n=1 Tax=Collinsella sp. SGI.033 TaxID=3420552 RepID=UPI003CFFD9EC
MKIQVKETLARRRTVFVLTLAAIVGVCAFTFSGTQNYAWAEGEGPIATWNRVLTPGYVVPETGGKNLPLEIKVAGSGDHLEAHITNNDGDTIPPSVLELTTEDGSVLTARFDTPISLGENAASSIEGSKPTTRFTKAELYETVTVTFNMNSHGTQIINPITVKKGTSVALPQPTDPNYDFGGWFTDESLTISFNGTAATSMTVYAKWTEKEKVTVSFESEFGTAPEAVTVNKGQVVELPDLGTDGDYTFVGWIPKGSEGTDPLKGEYTAKENITFTAVWETPTIEMVDVTFDMNGHGDSVTKQTEKGKPITLIDDPTAEGYTFKGWTYDKEGKQAFDPKKNADQDTTLYAQWKKNADSAPTNSTIPRTGDNQMALLASLCFSAAALIAVGIALTAYRKCEHV